MANSTTSSFTQQTVAHLLTPNGIFLLAFLLIAYLLFIRPWGKSSGKEPPFLGGNVFKNTYQYMTDMQGFLERVA